MKKSSSAVAVLVSLAFFAAPALAEPPPWAKAHGWRKKNDPEYVGYTGKKWDKDYGVLEGKCNTAAVGAVLGGAVGGVIGAKAGSGDDRPIAIVVGTVIGAVIGSKIGAAMDEGDRGCMGHALELAGEKKVVTWTNSATGVSYRLMPTRNFVSGKRPCREFTTQASHGKKKSGAIKGIACRNANGDWDIRI